MMPSAAAPNDDPAFDGPAMVRAVNDVRRDDRRHGDLRRMKGHSLIRRRSVIAAYVRRRTEPVSIPKYAASRSRDARRSLA